MPVVEGSVAEPPSAGTPLGASGPPDHARSRRGPRDALVARTVYGGYRLGALASQLVPGRRVPGLARRLGRLGALGAGDRRAMAALHQRRVRPERSDAEIDVAVPTRRNSSKAPISFQVAMSEANERAATA